MNTKNIISDISTKVGLPFLIAGASLAFAIQDTHAQVQTPQTKQQKEIVISLQDSTELSYNRVSEMLEANQITQAMNILAMKPDLAASLTQEQVQQIGWKKWVTLGATTFALIPTDQIPAGEPWITMHNENANWAATSDQNIVMQMLKERIETAREKAETARLTDEVAREKAETALMKEITSDLETRKEYSNSLSEEENKMMMDEILQKIRRLDDKKVRDEVLKDLQKAGVDISIAKN